MKININYGLVSMISLAGCNDTAKLESDLEKQDYSYGFFIGDDLLNKKADVNMPAFISGIKDGVNDTQKLSDEDIQEAFIALEKSIKEKYATEMAEKK